MRKTKLVKDLEIGDRVVLYGQTWELRRKIPQRSQPGWRAVYGTQYHLMLRVVGYQNKKWEGDRLSEEFSAYIQSERDRLDQATKWLVPFSQTIFVVE